MVTTSAIVLAAGLGTRMRSRLPKVLHPLCGRPMLAYVLEAAREATAERPLVVVSPAFAEPLRERFGDAAEFVLQAEPRGTGDALRAALEALPAAAEDVLVLSGDTPLLSAATIAALAAQHHRAGAAMTLAAILPEEPDGYGRVVRDPDGVARIVEEKDATPAELAIDEVNGGLYAFDARWLRGRLGDLRPSAATGEVYLTGLVELARADGRLVDAYEVDEAIELFGINDRVQLATAEADLRWRILEGHLLAGVTMVDPSTVYVDADVELAEDVVLEPNVVLRGQTRVGGGSTIGAGSQLFDSEIGAGCRIWASILEGAIVEDEATVGPFAHLRPGSHIGRGAELGNFAEVKNSRLGPRTKQHHMSYLGDATVGEGVNVGAGTITANYDGRRKHRTTVGDGAFLGVDTMLVAPVEIGAGARTGAGAVVTHDVPAGKLAVGVPARIREPHPPRTPDDPAGTSGAAPSGEGSRSSETR
ncbi:MAG: bifunctional UDP-N-acetylglucosamine diphosphorylase/glucosamine-1-phosphate N-acetyltransferase GlmU [Candidatus Limnocylindrales bacterium]